MNCTYPSTSCIGLMSGQIPGSAHKLVPLQAWGTDCQLLVRHVASLFSCVAFVILVYSAGDPLLHRRGPDPGTLGGAASPDSIRAPANWTRSHGFVWTVHGKGSCAPNGWGWVGCHCQRLVWPFRRISK